LPEYALQAPEICVAGELRLAVGLRVERKLMVPVTMVEICVEYPLKESPGMTELEAVVVLD